MAFAPEFTTLAALTNEERLARFNKKIARVPHKRSMAAALDELDALIIPKRSRKKPRRGLAHSLERLMRELDAYNRSCEATREVPFDKAH